MTLSQSVILGAIQGITEFFPVSSSGHLVIFQALFGLKEPQLAFDIFLHLGTIIAILIFFRKDIVSLFSSDRKTGIFIVIASIPTFIIAILFKDIFEAFFSMPKLASCMLGVTGGWLILASIGQRNRAGAAKLNLFNSILIGIAQGIAIIPGISRSGATIATGMLSGLDGEKCVRFSFLLSVPAVLGAVLFKFQKIGEGLTGSEIFVFLAGGISAFVFGIAAIKVLLMAVKRKKLYIFGLYCILAGLIGIIMF